MDLSKIKKGNKVMYSLGNNRYTFGHIVSEIKSGFFNKNKFFKVKYEDSEFLHEHFLSFDNPSLKILP